MKLSEVFIIISIEESKGRERLREGRKREREEKRKEGKRYS